MHIKSPIFHINVHLFVCACVDDQIYFLASGRNTTDLAINIYTNKQKLVGVYLDPRQTSDTSMSAENWNYEDIVVVHQCRLLLI